MHYILHLMFAQFFVRSFYFFFFFFNDTATTEIYTLSLHDALPILVRPLSEAGPGRARRFTIAALKQGWAWAPRRPGPPLLERDRKSTRLNSSHLVISYAVFCLKKKKRPRQILKVE